eukprot:PLAT6290.3.p1 GENE.PLAT6290.3~~PLAT6290.3.p1  ORF type:complete len:1136 (+),score=616.63 PLAT6290.3:42-3410(+)
MAFDPASLPELLGGLASADNDYRRSCEDVYFGVLRESAADMLLAQVELLTSSDDVFIRSFTAVLLRRLLSLRGQNPLLRAMAPQALEHVKSTLLAVLSNETDAFTRRRLCHAIAQASLFVLDGEWDELLDFCLTSLDTEEEEALTSGFYLLNAVLDVAADAFVPMWETLEGAIRAGMASDSANVRRYAFMSLCTFAPKLPEEGQPLEHLLPEMLSCTSDLIGAGLLDASADCLMSLLEALRARPDLFEAFIAPLAEAMLSIAGEAEAVEGSLRLLALQAMVELARHCGPRLREWPEIVTALLETAFAGACELYDDEDWGADEDDSVMDEMGPPCVSVLITITGLLGGPATWPTLSARIVEAMNTGDDVEGGWCRRWAALSVLGSTAVSMRKQLGAVLEETAAALLPYLSDDLPRVRNAAAMCLARMAEVFGDRLALAVADDALPALAAILEDAGLPPALHSHACAAIINLCCEGIPVGKVLSHAPRLVPPLLVAGGVGNELFVREQAVVAIGIVAVRSQEGFQPWYLDSMNLVRTVLDEVEDVPETALLRGRALETAGLLGESLGREAFAPDGIALLTALLDSLPAVESGVKRKADANSIFFLKCIARLGRVLEDDFLPFLPDVLHRLMQSMTVDCELHIDEVDEGVPLEELPDGFAAYMITVRGIGKRRMALNTTAVMEIKSAVRTLNQYCATFGAGMAEHAEGLLGTLLELVVFPYGPEVRSVAAATVAALVGCVTTAVTDGLVDAAVGRGMLDAALSELLPTLDSETNLETRNYQAEAISDLLHVMYDSSDVFTFPLEGVPSVFDTLGGTIDKSLQRRQEAVARVGDDESAMDLLEDTMSDEESLSRHCIDCIGWLIKAHGAAILPAFRAGLEDFLRQLLSEDCAPAMRLDALLSFEDLVEHAAPDSAEYAALIAPVLLQMTQDEDLDLRMCSLWGLGMLAEHAGDVYSQLLPEPVEIALRQLADPDAAYDEDIQRCCDNAVTLLAKTAMSHGEHPAVDQNAVLTAWLSALPLRLDEEEARFNHKLLAELVENGHPVVSEAAEAVPQLLNVFAVVLAGGVDGGEAEEDLADDETRARMGQLVMTMQSSLPEATMAAALGALTEDARYFLEAGAAAVMSG